MNYSGFNDLAEEQNFIACYPQGTTDASGNAFWNVCYSFHSFISIDDVQFIRTLSSHITQEYHLTDYNIFSTGMSNGGDMSYLLACQASDIIRAIAPVAGCMMEWIYESCSPVFSRPVFEIHGTNDNTTWREGDYNNTGGWGNYMAVMPTFNLG
jgi:polyhydroxybutyrate depolymerase